MPPSIRDAFELANEQMEEPQGRQSWVFMSWRRDGRGFQLSLSGHSLDVSQLRSAQWNRGKAVASWRGAVALAISIAIASVEGCKSST